ncbi:MAG: helix-turn-helix transcriptional regulator [Flavobacteriaceae bacterium]
MERVLLNREGEKVLTAGAINEQTISSFFDQPNFYAVVFLEKGSGILSLDGREILLEDSKIFFYYPYQKLSLLGELKGVLIQFHPDFFCIDIHAKDVGCQGLLFNNFFNDNSLKPNDKKFYNLFQFYKNIYEELSRKEVGQLDMVSSQLKMFLINAVRAKKDSQEKRIIDKENMHHQIEKLIERNYHSQSSSEFYINALKVSLTTFNRLCKRYFQNSFITILNLKRIASAKKKLFLTNIPVKEIAYQVGYNDPLYFSRVFKKYSGVSPKEFRNQLKNNRLI